MYWTFIGLTSILILAALVTIANSLFKKRGSNGNAINPDILFLKDQLIQLDKEVKQGIIEQSEAEFSKVKISRKILHFATELTNDNQNHNAPIKITTWIWCSISIIVSLGTYKTYDLIGGDIFVPRAQIVKKSIANDGRDISSAQEIAEQLIASAKENKKLTNNQNDALVKLVKELKDVLKQRPNDLKGHMLLVKNSARLQDFVTARIAQEKVLSLLGEKADSFNFSNYAELCIRAAAGYLSPEAKMAIEKAMFINPDNPQAKFYLSLQFLQENKSPNAFKIWMELLDKEPLNSRWITMIFVKMATVYSFFDFEKKTTEKAAAEISSGLLPLLQLLDSLELRLNEKNGTIEDWAVLIRGYHLLNIKSKVNQNIRKVKSLFSLNASQIIQLESY